MEILDLNNNPLPKNTLYIRPDPYWNDLEKSNLILKYLNQISTARTDHTILHELCHLEHYKQNKEKFLNYQNLSIEKFYEIIKRNLGERATYNVYEFIAEYSVARIDKIKIQEADRETLEKLYQMLGGFR